MAPPDPSHVTCALCRRGHDPDAPCPVVADEGAGREGETVGERYELLGLLGAGGMGAVYEARHKLIGRRCAVKLLHPQYARQAQMLTRFQREARAAASLENEHIAAVTDFGFAGDGVPFLVMERLEGEDLAALLAREGPLPVARAVSLLGQACRGLAAAHASDIVHRDLKPANLFLTRRSDGGDLVKVLDFGIAKLLDADDTGAAITGTGKLLGTACYMPPEQAKGESDIDHRADIYALGAILYELLTATKAHPGTNYNAVLFHILTQTIVPLRSLRGDLPPGLDAVVERAMAFDRGDRFASVIELHDAVARFAGTPVTPVRARANATTTPRISPALAPTVATPATAAGSPPPPVRAPVRRARNWGWAIAGAALAVAAAMIFVFSRPRPAAPAPRLTAEPDVSPRQLPQPEPPKQGVMKEIAPPPPPPPIPPVVPNSRSDGDSQSHPKKAHRDRVRSKATAPIPGHASEPDRDGFDTRNPYAD